MARLPDAKRSCAVLIGSSAYQSAELPNLPAIRNNLRDLYATLTDPELSGFDPEKCIVISDGSELRTVYRTLRQYARRAEDTLLVYFAGHGLIGALRHELYLALPDTDPDELQVSAFPFEVIRELLHDCPAANRVLILDCCFSGRAARGFMTSSAAAVMGHIDVAGTYTLASTSANATSVALKDATYTAFTGELLALLRNGVPEGPELLTLGDIYRRLQHTLASKGLPAPTQRGTDTADLLALARNRRAEAERPPADSLIAGSGSDSPTPHGPTSRARRIVILAAVIVVLGTVAAVLMSSQTNKLNTPRSQERDTTSLHTNTPATPSSIKPDPAALNTAVQWARAWMNHEPGLNIDEWLEGLRPYTTEAYLSTLSEVNPADIGGLTLGEPRVEESRADSVVVDFSEGSVSLQVTVVRTAQGWLVSHHEQVELIAVRVLNGSTIRGLAGKAAKNFRDSGWNIVGVGNYTQSAITRSTVWYRPGTNEETPARYLANSFDMDVQPRPVGMGDEPSGLIVVVTNDYQGAGE